MIFRRIHFIWIFNFNTERIRYNFTQQRLKAVFKYTEDLAIAHPGPSVLQHVVENHILLKTLIHYLELIYFLDYPVTTPKRIFI